MQDEGTLPIRRLTLYKHGVGFVEREGTVEGEEIALSFRSDEVNDALKSLLVLDRRGGQVLGIDYDTPVSAMTRPAGTPLTLTPDHSLLDLLRGLRGWQVRLVAGAGTGTEEYVGRLLGIDVADLDAPFKDAVVALLDEASDAILSLPLHEVRQVVLLEERASGDLRRFLDSSRDRDAGRSVTVRLSPGAHDLAVSYLVPSPTWRVSYRLVVESVASDNGRTGSGTGEDAALLLQGWGLFDNGLDEDLDGVAVTLVAGQPISFVYDLAASRIPARPVVEDAARVAAGPVEYEGGFAAPPPAAAPAAYNAAELDVLALAQPRMARMAREERGAPAASISQMAGQTVAATGSDLGELFQYEVTAPVSVRRGASALVPILNTRLRCRRELLFNEGKLPEHPVAALRFANTTGLVLERGPVTVLEDGAYRGEAIVPFSKEGADVYLAYLVELGIRVTVETSSSVETAGIRITGAVLETRQAVVKRTQYRIENNLGEMRRVTVEHSFLPGAELVDVRAPDTQTAEFYRWAVACPAREVTAFAVAERQYVWRSSQLFDHSYAALQDYWRLGWLDGAALSRVTGLLKERAAIAADEEELNKLQAERKEVYGREEQTRKNMAALSTAGEEGNLRKRAVAQLQASEERLTAIHTHMVSLQEDIARRQTAIDEQLASLKVDGA